ncbi:MAG: MerR family transcriptional regulator [Firmicutes bacterium]|nr:MerR family transcriptional regulator [Bacillota bacterium]
MRTVKEVSSLTGISVRTLHYYDQIGLLKPSQVTEAGYRLYDDTALEKLQQIMLYRELEFPLKDIKNIMESSDFDRNRALEQQIEMLTLKKEHLENLITFARGIELLGVKYMDFTAFDTKKLDEYAEEAKKNWGKTDAYKEFEEKAKGRTKAQDQQMGAEIMVLFVEFGEMVRSGCTPADDKVQAQVKKLQDFITENFYTCTNQILSGLGKMYAGGGEFTTNIDKAGGEGTAAFVNQAIEVYCK